MILKPPKWSCFKHPKQLPDSLKSWIQQIFPHKKKAKTFQIFPTPTLCPSHPKRAKFKVQAWFARHFGLAQEGPTAIDLGVMEPWHGKNGTKSSSLALQRWPNLAGISCFLQPVDCRRSTGKTSFFLQWKELGRSMRGSQPKVVNPFLFVGRPWSLVRMKESKIVKHPTKKKAPEFCASSTEAPCLLEEMLTGGEVLFSTTYNLNPYHITIKHSRMHTFLTSLWLLRWAYISLRQEKAVSN